MTDEGTPAESPRYDRLRVLATKLSRHERRMQRLQELMRKVESTRRLDEGEYLDIQHALQIEIAVRLYMEAHPAPAPVWHDLGDQYGGPPDLHFEGDHSVP